MKNLESLKQASSKHGFAWLLGYKSKTISYILYKIPSDKKYTTFTIPKKNGGVRVIKAPNAELKNLQKRLANLLNKCFEEINEGKGSLSHGFRKKHSIITNAINHKSKRHVFNIDLENFFPTFNFGRVRGFFIKNSHFKLEPDIATIIAQIACHDNELPQGSPSSPIISNLIAHILDIRMVNLAKKNKCTYSRYADDLTFSTNKKEFPAEIAFKKGGDDEVWEPGKLIKKEIEKVGFKINDNKTSMQHKTNRQMATGLIVNRKINIRREYYKHARSMCYNLFKTGDFYLPQFDENSMGSMNQLEGILSYICQIKEHHDSRKSRAKRHAPNSATKLYREFLFYKHFFSLNKPLIISEGKTDIIYLKCALKELEKDYSHLYKKNEDGFEFSINFLNISKNFKNILAMAEGTSGFVSLMEIYKKHMMRFEGSGQMCPVILLVDNDDGSDEIKKKLKIKNFKEKFYKYHENLYVVPILDSIKEKEMAIEGLFDKETLEIKVDEKTFNRKAKLDTESEYSKIVFAEKVVKTNQKSIDFSGFKYLFNNITEVIEYHKILKTKQTTTVK